MFGYFHPYDPPLESHKPAVDASPSLFSRLSQTWPWRVLAWGFWWGAAVLLFVLITVGLFPFNPWEFDEEDAKRRRVT